MSQVAILEGNIGNGQASNYAIYEHHSDARAWSVTVSGKAEAKFDYFSACAAEGCAFKSDEDIIIAINRIKNVGDIQGVICVEFEELDASGNPLPGGLYCGDCDSIESGKCICLDYDEYASAPCMFFEPDICDDNTGRVRLKPRSPGTYYFGIKTWAPDYESEPPYPSPTAALAGAEVFGRRRDRTCDTCNSRFRLNASGIGYIASTLTAFLIASKAK